MSKNNNSESKPNFYAVPKEAWNYFKTSIKQHKEKCNKNNDKNSAIETMEQFLYAANSIKYSLYTNNINEAESFYNTLGKLHEVLKSSYEELKKDYPHIKEAAIFILSNLLGKIDQERRSQLSSDYKRQFVI